MRFDYGLIIFRRPSLTRRAKVAITRQRKKNSTCNRADVSRKDNDAHQDAYNCTTCGVAYAEDEGEFWISM